MAKVLGQIHVGAKEKKSHPKLCEVVQRDADVLWWSRDPTLETSEDADGSRYGKYHTHTQMDR